MEFDLEELKSIGISEDPSLHLVEIDGLVVLKIIKHCRENLPELVTGQLLGLDVKTTLEVTDCFPFPTKIGDDEEDNEPEAIGGAEYQIEMMRCLREVNVDNNTVGWYSSTYMGSFLNESTLETQYNYQRTIPKSVVLIYDPLKTSQGILALKSYRLTQPFMNLYKPNQSLSKESLAKENLSFKDIFEEIPVKIHNAQLVNAFLIDLEEKGASLETDFDRLDLSTNSYLEKNLEFLIECLDDLSAEQNKFQYHQRNVQKQQYQQSQWVAKRRAENAARAKNGEEILPLEDPSNPIFKPIPEPNRLESLLITNQISNYCKQINQFSANSLSKIYLLGALQKE